MSAFFFLTCFVTTSGGDSQWVHTQTRALRWHHLKISLLSFSLSLSLFWGGRGVEEGAAWLSFFARSGHDSGACWEGSKFHFWRLRGALFTNQDGGIQVLPAGTAALVFEGPHVHLWSQTWPVGLSLLAAVGRVRVALPDRPHLGRRVDLNTSGL